VDNTQQVRVTAGQTHPITLVLTQDRGKGPATPSPAGEGFVPSEWAEDEGWREHKGPSPALYRAPSQAGTWTFTIAVRKKTGGLFGGSRDPRFVVGYKDGGNHVLYSLEKSDLVRRQMENGRKKSETKRPHGVDPKNPVYQVQVDVAQGRIVTRVRNSAGQWQEVDTLADPTFNPADGKFGIWPEGKDEVGIQNFQFRPR
jgi:hypothetical protein